VSRMEACTSRRRSFLEEKRDVRDRGHHSDRDCHGHCDHGRGCYRDVQDSCRTRDGHHLHEEGIESRETLFASSERRRDNEACPGTNGELKVRYVKGFSRTLKIDGSQTPVHPITR